MMGRDKVGLAPLVAFALRPSPSDFHQTLERLATPDKLQKHWHLPWPHRHACLS
jgi:hypothetical protein